VLERPPAQTGRGREMGSLEYVIAGTAVRLTALKS
jgi:hypothetical protein